MTGAFKERGALNKILLLTPEEAQRGVIAASAGNHAQAVAYHATRHGIRSTIVMPAATPLVKVMATQNYGAEVILHGANYDEACEHALALGRRARPDVSAPLRRHRRDRRAGHHRPRIARAVPATRSGGRSGRRRRIDRRRGLRHQGTASRSESHRRADGAPAFHGAALEQHAPVTIPSASTIADGIAVRRAGEVTYPLVAKYVDEIVTVEEEEIASAILTLLEREKMLAEGAGAAGTAALLQHKTKLERPAHRRASSAAAISTFRLLSRIIERGLVKDGRLVRIRIYLPDRPGALAELSSVIAGQSANIVELLFDRAYYGVSLGDTAIDVTLETRGAEHVAELLAAISSAGYTPRTHSL